jgi:aminoglycoside phosphotransferase family enzyme/predicted kinase
MDRQLLADSRLESQAEVTAFLGEGAVQHFETHAAHVFLTGDIALKLKKAIRLPYLDYSTLARRKEALDRELKINRAYAPDLYLDVRPIIRSPSGELGIGGRGTTIDWVLRMKRFPVDSLLSDWVKRGDLDDRLSLSLAAVVADAHARAAARDWDGVGIMAALEQQLFQAFRAEAALFGHDKVNRFCVLYADRFHHAKALLAARAKAGLVRRCHGDLHCGNIVIIDDRPVLFDAIEFSERIATCDVLYDLAFLLMDLLHSDQRRAASLLLNRYFELRREEESLGALSLMPLFLSTRAGVRAIVAFDRAEEMEGSTAEQAHYEAQNYFEVALGFLTPAPPRLIAIGGLSGTGKSTLGRSLCPALQPAPGAIHIRSDIERKTLFRAVETDRLGPDCYTEEASRQVYDAMFTRADEALAAGYSVVLDAVFSTERERAGAERIAAGQHVPFQGVWLEAAPETLKKRVSARKGDASDATAEVVERQLAYDLGDVSWTHVNASNCPQTTLERAMRVVLSTASPVSTG